MTGQDAVQLHKTVLSRVYSEEYYPHVAERLKEAVQFKDIEKTKSTTLIWLFWNAFWNALPDKPYIRTQLFFNICDLAEGSYLTPESK